jgi:outer membrane protein TolC
MRSVPQVDNRFNRMVIACLVFLLSGSMPLGAFAQKGVLTSYGQASQQRPFETRSDQKKALKPDQQTERDGQNSTAASAEVKSQQTEITQNRITQPLAVSPEVTTQRVGVNENQQELLTLQDAITLALKNNLDIEIFRQGVQIAQYNLFSLRGAYDIVSSSEISYRNQTFPVASIFAGGGANFSVTQRVLTYNFSTNQQIERTGGSWQIDFQNQRINTTSTAATLTTQYNPTLTLTFIQPLMRNLSLDQNRRQILLAKRQLDLSDSQFRQRVIEIINQVQRAYWDLVFAIRNEKIARETVELTRVQLENNRKMVEAGTLAPIELRSTEAALEARKGDVIVALQNITTAENTLKGLILKDPNDKLWYSRIVPTDEPQFGQPTLSLEEAIRTALQNRPELEQMRLQQQQKEVDIKFYKSQVKPQIDFVGLFTNTGLAGTPSNVLRGTAGFDPLTLGLINNLNEARAKLGLDPFTPAPPQPTTLGANVPDRFRGGYSQALSNLFSQDFRTVQVGVRLSFPWRNRTAEGNLGRALAEARQLDARQRQLIQSIQIDVRNALQAVEAARQRYEAAVAGRIAAEAQYQGELERFRAGLSTNFFVLQRQTDLSTAKGSEVRALTDYNKALADLQRVTGLTLVSNNVKISAIEQKDVKLTISATSRK